MAVPEGLRIGDLDGASVVRTRRTTQELVFEFLRDAILSGRLRGGAHLVQDKIASELNVSRVPVREALLQLESEGLVRMEPHRGASVVWLSPEQIVEIFEIRLVLVTAALRLVVPHLTDDQVRRLDQIAQRQEAESNMAARARLNHAFYATLFEDLGRPRWRSMIDRLEREVERYLLPLDRPHLGHLELVAACRPRDAERAAELVGKHLRQVAERAAGRVRELADSGSPHVAILGARGKRGLRARPLRR
ncbi:MAG TPA: GntR family transcriptional regulator [Chloroflexota bacterium]|nr:GntR family transcriptional regulator [Chloroflexota bacterium]